MKTSIKILSLVSLSALMACGGAPKNNQTEIQQQSETPITIETKLVEWAKNANIYEVNVRQYTPEGTLEALKAHLPRLKEQNVDILWLMPITPISDEGRKGTLGSYYAVKNYTEVNPEFGNLDDMKAFVNEAHKLGMKVIIDWVANHTGRDNVWTKQHKEWFNQDKDGNIISPEGTDWSDVSDLNYDNQEMRQAMIDAMKFWITNTDIDGFRCDMAGMVPTDFWVQARKQLDEIKPIFFLAEDDKPEIHNAFDVSYNWEVHHILNDIAQKTKNADSLEAIIKKLETKFKPSDILLNFTSNHDENTWQKSEYDRMGNHAKQMAVLTYCLPGMPLTYSGQEAENKKALRFFDKDTIDFSKIALKDFYAELNKFKHENQDIWNGEYGQPIQFIKNDNPDFLEFQRGDLYFGFYFGDSNVAPTVSGAWRTLLADKLHPEGAILQYGYLIMKKEE